MSRPNECLTLCLLLILVSSPIAWAGGGMSRWLELSYVESEDVAGFGEYPYDRLEPASLYATHGAVVNASYNGIPVEDGGAIVEWIASLQQPCGSFDDPVTDAPVLNETVWALQTLRLLGADLLRFADALTFLEGTIATLSLDGIEIADEFRSAMFDLHLVSACKSELATAGLLLDESVLESLREDLASVSPRMDSRIETASVWSWDGDDEAVWAYVIAVAQIAPETLSQASIEFLESHLGTIKQHAPAHFLACAWIRDLLVAGAAAFRWETIPQAVAEQVWEFLVDRVFPATREVAGYGWTDRDGVHWLDAQMTVPLIQLCHLLGRSYPFAAPFSATLLPLRGPSGWSQQVQIVPDASSTFFALEIARQIGWAGFSERKVLSFFKSVIQAPDSLPSDVAYAAKGWAALVADTSELQLELAARLAEASVSWIQSDIAAVASIAYEFAVPVSETNLLRLLEDFGQQLLSRLAQSTRLDLLWLLIKVDTILGNETLNSDDVIDFVLSQHLADGGFRVSSDLPGQLLGVSDTLTTYTALLILAHYGMAGLDRIRCDAVAGFLQQCKSADGYLLAPEETLLQLETPPDIGFFSTYLGLRLERFVSTGSL